MTIYPHHLNGENDIIIDISNDREVDQFIEHFFIDHGLSSNSSRIKIATLLKFLPENIKKKRDITSWIRKNWDKKFIDRNN